MLDALTICGSLVGVTASGTETLAGVSTASVGTAMAPSVTVSSAAVRVPTGPPDPATTTVAAADSAAIGASAVAFCQRANLLLLICSPHRPCAPWLTLGSVAPSSHVT
ncbi:hypothetical protein [Nocardioides zeae]|uniref:hypothetical protein n=1 Tax=Nocardioides zeae TaxID=1457234 RepID=UPI00286A342A|nr:hypothetical protein [Nocardioides zeae]